MPPYSDQSLIFVEFNWKEELEPILTVGIAALPLGHHFTIALAKWKLADWLKESYLNFRWPLSQQQQHFGRRPGQERGQREAQKEQD